MRPCRDTLMSQSGFNGALTRAGAWELGRARLPRMPERGRTRSSRRPGLPAAIRGVEVRPQSVAHRGHIVHGDFGRSRCRNCRTWSTGRTGGGRRILLASLAQDLNRDGRLAAPDLRGRPNVEKPAAEPEITLVALRAACPAHFADPGQVGSEPIGHVDADVAPCLQVGAIALGPPEQT